jgi:hypothetical protein
MAHEFERSFRAPSEQHVILQLQGTHELLETSHVVGLAITCDDQKHIRNRPFERLQAVFKRLQAVQDAIDTDPPASQYLKIFTKN